MFSQTAAFHDAVYAARGRSYDADAATIAALIRTATPDARTLLAVGCGTGGHLAAFERLGFACTGVEADLKLLAIARSRLPETAIEPADVTTFALERTFDAIVSLDGASALARTPARLDATLARTIAHLAPGGTIVVEPYLTFGAYRPGTLESIFVDEPELKIARVSLSKQTGKIGILDYHYLIANLQGIERYFERREVGLFSAAAYREAFERDGLTMRVESAYDGIERYVAV